MSTMPTTENSDIVMSDEMEPVNIIESSTTDIQTVQEELSVTNDDGSEKSEIDETQSLHDTESSSTSSKEVTEDSSVVDKNSSQSSQLDLLKVVQSVDKTDSSAIGNEAVENNSSVTTEEPAETNKFEMMDEAQLLTEIENLMEDPEASKEKSSVTNNDSAVDSNNPLDGAAGSKDNDTTDSKSPSASDEDQSSTSSKQNTVTKTPAVREGTTKVAGSRAMSSFMAKYVGPASTPVVKKPAKEPTEEMASRQAALAKQPTAYEQLQQIHEATLKRSAAIIAKDAAAAAAKLNKSAGRPFYKPFRTGTPAAPTAAPEPPTGRPVYVIRKPRADPLTALMVPGRRMSLAAAFPERKQRPEVYIKYVNEPVEPVVAPGTRRRATAEDTPMTGTEDTASNDGADKKQQTPEPEETPEMALERARAKLNAMRALAQRVDEERNKTRKRRPSRYTSAPPKKPVEKKKGASANKDNAPAGGKQANKKGSPKEATKVVESTPATKSAGKTTANKENVPTSAPKRGQAAVVNKLKRGREEEEDSEDEDMPTSRPRKQSRYKNSGVAKAVEVSDEED